MRARHVSLIALALTAMVATAASAQDDKDDKKEDKLEDRAKSAAHASPISSPIPRMRRPASSSGARSAWRSSRA